MSANLKILRNRIASISGTKKITKAMQMIAVTKSNKSKQISKIARHYPEICQNILQNIICSYEVENFKEIAILDKILSKKSQGSVKKKSLFVVFSTDKGLCGGVNTSLINHVNKSIDSLKSQKLNSQDLKLIVFGKKAKLAFSKKYKENILNSYPACNNVSESMLVVKDAADQILQMIETSQVDDVVLYYTHSKNFLIQEVKTEQILPLILDPNFKEQKSTIEGDNILIETLKQYIFGKMHNALIESYVSEQNARLVAMDNATKNAESMITDLTLLLNRSRQAKITSEITEICAGAEASNS